MNETKPKKMFSRTIAIAGIICILVVGVVSLVVVLNLQNQVNGLSNTVNLSKYEVWLSFNATQPNISQQAGSYTSLRFSPSHSGYIVVWLSSADSYNTYVQVIYTANVSVMSADIIPYFDYDNRIAFGTNGTGSTTGAGIFPVLPATIEIRVGNTNPVGVGGWKSPTDIVSEWVQINYYY